MKFIQLKVELEEVEALSMLTDALETGAIGYWATGSKVKYTEIEDDSRYVVSFMIHEMDEEGGVEKTFAMNTDVLKKGIERVFMSNKYSFTAGAILRNDVDSQDLDIIIQLACFDEVRYS